MAALTSLIRLSIMDGTRIGIFFVAITEVEPFFLHVETLVDALEDLNTEKHYFRALIGLARATALRYLRGREDIPGSLAHNTRQHLIKLLHAYGYVLGTSSIPGN